MIHHEHKRIIPASICIIAILCLLIGCTGNGAAITSLDQLGEPGRKIGVPGDMLEFDTLKSDYPNAEVLVYNDYPAAYEEVAKGRLDAFVYARREMEFALANGTTGVRLLEENYSNNTVAVGISPKASVPDLKSKINAFLAKSKADGTLDDMYLRWVIQADDAMPDIAMAEHPSMHLRIGTTGTVMPYSYYVGTELRGYDIELAYRFASWIGADVEFKIYDFGGIVAAAQSGDVDCIMSNLYVTPENSEAIPFSDPLFDVEITAMVRDDGTAPKSAGGTVHWQDYNGKKLGVLVGPLMEDAAKQFFPDSEYMLFDSYPDCVTALLTGKIDGFLGDEPGMKSLHAEQPEVDYIHESLTENNYSFAFRKDDPKSTALCNELNAFLKKSWEDGTMEELDLWFGVDEAKKVVDMSDLTGKNGTIRVVTTSTDMPWSYIKDGKNVGYDIDLVVRFCRDRGYALEIGDVDFAGRIPAIQSGKYDFTTDMNVTPERMEQVLFSDPTSHGGIVLAVRASDLAASSQPEFAAEYSEYSDLSGKRVSMLTGAPFEELVRSKVPDVGEFSYFNNAPDTILALKSGKTDAFLTNNAVGALAVNRNPELALFPQDLDTSAFGIAFAKGDPARDMWQAAYDAISEETKNALWEKWTGSDDSVKLLPEQDWPGSNGTVQAAVCDSLEPMSYMGNGGQPMGFDIEMILLMAKELDVHVEFTGMEFSAIMSSVQAGKALLGAGSIIATDERKQSVDFVEYYPAAFVLVVRAFRIETGRSFLSAIADSFQKTFIRENRWKLFLVLI